MVALAALQVAGGCAVAAFITQNDADKALASAPFRLNIPTWEEAMKNGPSNYKSVYDVSTYTDWVEFLWVMCWLALIVAALAMAMWASAKPRRHKALRGAVPLVGRVIGFEDVSIRKALGPAVVPAKVRFDWEGQQEVKTVSVFLMGGHPGYGGLEDAKDFLKEVERDGGRSAVLAKLSIKESTQFKHRYKEALAVVAEGNVKELPLWFFPKTGHTIVRTAADDALMGIEATDQ
ncbi:MAG: hypothetical protein LBR27_09700 [Bifidobacteriaceae bacterium]|nr:hypothetical protein [Bifidobacteriaceae bacterium]